MRRMLAGAFVLASVFYVAGFALDRHMRTRRGPWEVRFGATERGEASLQIRQQALGVEEVCLVFEGQSWTNRAVEVRFQGPGQPVPFGKVKYHDLTTLPGVVTLELFGHEIELLPRTLYVDRRAVGWVRSTNLVLSAAGYRGDVRR